MNNNNNNNSNISSKCDSFKNSLTLNNNSFKKEYLISNSNNKINIINTNLQVHELLKLLQKCKNLSKDEYNKIESNLLSNNSDYNVENFNERSDTFIELDLNNQEEENRDIVE